MNTMARLSVLIGAGLLTGASLAGPAQASPAGPQPPHMQGYVVGYFNDQSDCQWVGHVGNAQDRWDNQYCDQVDYGPYRGLWRLRVQSMGDGDNGWPGGGPGGGHGGPGGDHGWPGGGHGGPGGPGGPGGGHGGPHDH